MASRREFLGFASTTLLLAGCGSSTDSSFNVASAQTSNTSPAPQPFVAAADQGETFTWPGARLISRVLGSQDAQIFEMYFFALDPGGVVNYHVHNTFDETITVLEGEVEFNLEGRLTRALPGATAFIPRGHNHGFRNAGTGACRVQLVFNPASRQNEFFRKLEPLLRQPSPDPAALAALQREYDQVLVPI